MKQIPSIFRYKYRETANNLLSELNPLSLQYDEVLRQLAAINTQENMFKLKIIESKMAWLVNMIANILTSQSYVEMQLSMGQEDIDADLSKKVFDLLEKLDYQLDLSVYYYITVFIFDSFSFLLLIFSLFISFIYCVYSMVKQEQIIV